MATFKIKKGKHSSSPIFPLLAIGKKKELKWIVKFDDSVSYMLPNDNQLDINKLCGIGWFPSHHQNSVRFGWRYNEGTAKVDIFAYVYVKGQRLSSAVDPKLIASLDRNKEYELKMTLTDKSYVLEANGKAVVILKDWRIQSFGYYLKPYFGGDEVAPHDIIINLKRVK